MLIAGCAEGLASVQEDDPAGSAGSAGASAGSAGASGGATSQGGAAGSGNAGAAGTGNTAGSGAAGAAGSGNTGNAGSAGSGTAGSAGAGTAGSGNTGNAGTAGSGNTGNAGTAGSGNTGNAGTAGSGNAGTAGSGNAGTAGSGNAGTAGSGNTGNAGTAGSGNTGNAGTAGSGAAGTAGSGNAGTAGSGNAGTAGSGNAGTAGSGGGATCATPADACQDGGQSGVGCSSAKVVGRLTASTGTGFSVSADTCSRSNTEDEGASSCWDAGGDVSYRIFLRAGDTISASLDTMTRCTGGSTYDGTLKFYSPSAADCAPVTSKCTKAGGLLAQQLCERFIDTKARSFTATVDGWHYVIVDGSTAFDDEGDFKFTLKLTCPAGCGC
ncbi:MAG: hypothetical protein IT374_11510 [Polyangiaceae bacterium]|nr:hypothetical protein [Polyangiaceae bacterium]